MVLIRDMKKREVEALLRRNHVGRLAYSFHDRVEIRPIGYVFGKGWIFSRTSPGEKLDTMRHNQWVAFEVDEVRGPFDWASVVARGSLYRLDADGDIHYRKLRTLALRLLRKVMPGTLEKGDPVAFRTEVLGIKLDEVSGREASDNSGASD